MWRWAGTAIVWLAGPLVGVLTVSLLAPVMAPNAPRLTIGGDAKTAMAMILAFDAVWLLTAFRLGTRHQGRERRIHWIGAIAGPAFIFLTALIVLIVARILGKPL
jgi:hypothetical protein